MTLPDSLLAEFDELVKKYPEKRAGLIPALHRCQEDLGGWISPEIMEDLATYFEMEPVEVYGVTSFYPMFKLRPQGKHVIGICHNISCDLRGADEIVESVCKATGAQPGQTSEDGKFTVQTLECQGACTTAPMFDLDGVFHEELDADKVAAILGGLA
ncbi:MAG: NADH-quinone oxidoreductase subunit E [Planctomycetota bacterium]|jgi:NADH-quinone oxidoreductase subunit E